MSVILFATNQKVGILVSTIVQLMNWVEEQSLHTGISGIQSTNLPSADSMFHSVGEEFRLKDGRILPPCSMHISPKKKESPTLFPYCL